MEVAAVGRGLAPPLLASGSRSSSSKASLVTGSRPVSCNGPVHSTTQDSSAAAQSAAARARQQRRPGDEPRPSSHRHLDDFEDEAFLVQVSRLLGHYRLLGDRARNCEGSNAAARKQRREGAGTTPPALPGASCGVSNGPAGSRRPAIRPPDACVLTGAQHRAALVAPLRLGLPDVWLSLSKERQWDARLPLLPFVGGPVVMALSGTRRALPGA